MVVGESAVAAGAGNAHTAIQAAHVRSRVWSRLLCGGAGRERGGVRNELWERLQQTRLRGGTQVGVAVHRLEQVDRMIAGVTKFQSSALTEFALQSEAPGVDFVRPKIRTDIRLILGAWIEGVRRDLRLQRKPDVRPRWY